MDASIDARLQQLEERLDRLEGSTILLNTTQVQAVDAVEDDASTAEVRTAVQQIARALRTLGLGH
jgi:hypothetical protein